MRSRAPAGIVALTAVATFVLGGCDPQPPMTEDAPQLVSRHRPPAPAIPGVREEEPPSTDEGDTRIGLRDEVTITVTD